MPSRYDPETRARAVRLALDHRSEYPSEWAAITAVSSRLGMTGETLRNWIRQQQIDEGQRDGVSTEAAAEIRALKRRNRELEETIEVLAGYYEPDHIGRREPAALYGSVKMWAHLRREGIPVAKSTVERLMRAVV